MRLTLPAASEAWINNQVGGPLCVRCKMSLK